MRIGRFALLFIGLLALLVVPVLAQDATPTPGAGQQATATPDTDEDVEATAVPDTQTQTDTNQQTQVQLGPTLIRVGNFLTDAGVVDVYVNGQLALEDVNPAAVSAWIEVPARAQIAVVPAGASMEDAIIGPFTVTGRGPATVALTGSGATGNFNWRFLRETITSQQGQTGAELAGNARVTLVNTAEMLGNVNVQMTLVRPFTSTQDTAGAQDQSGQTTQGDEDNGQTFGESEFFNFGPMVFGDESASFTVPAGLYNISLLPSAGFGIESDLDDQDDQAQQGTQGQQTGQGFTFQDDRLNLAANWPSFSNVALNANTSYLFAITMAEDGLPWLVISSGDTSNVLAQTDFSTQGQQGDADQQGSVSTSSQDDDQGDDTP